MFVLTTGFMKLDLLLHDPEVRPSKKKNMFHVRVFQKKEEEGLFIFYFLFQDGRHSLLKCQISIVFSTAEIHKT